MIKCKLTKVSRPDVEGGLRTDEVEGSTDFMPTIGEPFQMLAAPLEGGSFRYVATSLVKAIVEESEQEVKFMTESGSIYTVEYIH